MELAHVGTEVGLDGFRQGISLTDVGRCMGIAEPQLTAEHGGATQGIVVERGGAEVGLAGRETPLQLVAVGEHHTGVVQVTAAVLQTPLDERPQLACLLTAAACHHIARRPVRNHGGIATVAGAVPDVLALGNDGAGDGVVVVVHETGEVEVGVERRGIARAVAREGEEGVDVLGLVVSPDSRVVRLAAGGVHIAAGGLEDALRGANLGKAELAVDDIVGGVEDEVVVHLTQEHLPCGELCLEVGVQRLLPYPICLKNGAERQALARLEDERAATRKVGTDDVGARHAPLGTGGEALRIGGDIDSLRTGGDVAEGVALAHQRFVRRGEDAALEFNGGRQVAATRCADVGLPHGEGAANADAAVNPHLLHLLAAQRKTVDAQERRDVGADAVHQAGMGVVGDGAQHGEHQRALAAEAALLVHAPAEHDGHLLAAHLDVVGIGQRGLGGGEDDGVGAVGECPADVALVGSRHAAHAAGCQQHAANE